jgi:hypothetical protein
VVVVFSEPLRLLEFWSSQCFVLVVALFVLFFSWASKGFQFLAYGERRVLEDFLVEMLFKARSCKLSWFSFNKNPHVAVVDFLWSRWMPDEFV